MALCSCGEHYHINGIMGKVLTSIPIFT